MIDATHTRTAELITLHIDIILGRLIKEDSYLTYLDSHHIPLINRPRTAQERRQRAVARVCHTWARREHDNPKAVAEDIQSLYGLGRAERWHDTITRWAHITRENPDMFQSLAIHANRAA